MTYLTMNMTALSLTRIFVQAMIYDQGKNKMPRTRKGDELHVCVAYGLLVIHLSQCFRQILH